jgi:hypothetical protein
MLDCLFYMLDCLFYMLDGILHCHSFFMPSEPGLARTVIRPTFRRLAPLRGRLQPKLAKQAYSHHHNMCGIYRMAARNRFPPTAQCGDEHLVNIQCTFSERLVYIQWTLRAGRGEPISPSCPVWWWKFSVHSVYIQCTFGVHSVNIEGWPRGTDFPKLPSAVMNTVDNRLGFSV